MPDTGTLLLFTLVAIGFVAIPGPSNLYVLGRGLQSGTRAAIAGAAGCGSGAMVYVAATAAGLSALIASSQALFAALHYAGAAYLSWLGVTTWRAAGQAAAPAAAAAAALQVLVLGAVFVSVGFASDCLYAIGSGRPRHDDYGASSWIVQPAPSRR